MYPDTDGQCHLVVVTYPDEGLAHIGLLDRIQKKDHQPDRRDDKRGEAVAKILGRKDTNHAGIAAEQVALGIDQSHHLGKCKADQEEERTFGLQCHVAKRESRSCGDEAADQ